MTTNLSNLEIDEISILSKNVRPAVRAARIAIAKKETPMNEPLAFDTFEQAIEHLEKVHVGSCLAAMSEAAKRYPELVHKYNDQGAEIAKAAREAAKPRAITKAVQDFELAIDEIQRRDGAGRSDAMSKARAEFPTEFAAYQTA